MTKVTYKIREQGDPMETTLGGIKFRANEPIDIPDDASSELLTRETKVGVDGEIKGKGKEGQQSIIEMAKRNPWFEVEGTAPAIKAKPGRPALPKTTNEYRSYAMQWFRITESAKQLAERWENEATLREKIGIHEGGEDYSYLTPFFEQRMHELKRAA